MQKFQPRTFDKLEIKKRMVERATKIWQTQSNQLDGFDPLVELLFEACAVELEKIANEIDDTRERVIDRLANLMNPDIIDIIQPAHAILQAKSIDPFAVVMPKEQFFYKAPAEFGAGYNANYEFFFSPIHSFRIFNGEIKYMATQEAIHKIEEGLHKSLVCSNKMSRNRDVVDYHRLWLGIELYEGESQKIESLEGFSFFFDWHNDPYKEKHYQVLPFTQWFIEDVELPFRVGIFPEYADSLDIDDEFDPLRKLEKSIKQFYDKCFVSFKSEEYDTNRRKRSEDKKKKWPIYRKAYPEVFDKLFGKETLSHRMREELVWIEIRFPLDFDAEYLENIFCGINAFPALNRKLNQFTYPLQENLNIIPLISEQPFLAVKSIIDDEGVSYKSSPFTNLENLKFDTFTLRQKGVGRFDSRDAKELLYYVLELLQDESRSYEALGNDFLSSTIKELNQNISQLEKQLSKDSIMIQAGSIPYITIKPKNHENNVSVEFWSSDGEIANEIPGGSPMIAFSDIYVDANKVFMLTNSNGGHEKMKETEKINALKKHLLTRNRIVTEEDIRVSCLAFLGDDIREMEISKGFMISHHPEEGFIRCIRVDLFPAKKSIEKDWEIISQQLKIELESRSANNLPYRIEVIL